MFRRLKAQVGSGFYFGLNTHMLVCMHNCAKQERVMRKAPVSERALIQRLNVIVERRLDSTDLQSLGRAKRVLADWEAIFVNSSSIW